MSGENHPLSTNPNEADWCRVRETLLMLNLAVAQISGAMLDGDQSVNDLTESFTTMMKRVDELQQAALSLTDSEEKNTIYKNCEGMDGQMQKAVVAFQFYDKLSQRLNHLNRSLTSFARLMATPELIHDPDAWHLLQEEIKSRYALDTDKAMFDAILDGKSVEEALAIVTSLGRSRQDNDIELF